MKLSDLPTADQVLAEDLKDASFRAEWDRMAFARDVAKRLISYRVAHDLTQAGLARRVGTVQSVIGRLETGEHPPSLATLAKLSTRLGIEFHIDITPASVSLSASP